MDIKQLYQDIILEHGKSPRNKGKCENYNHDAQGYNPLCGDKVHVYLKLNDNKKIEDLTFEGEGCAISLASASIMTELLAGKTIIDVKEIMKARTDVIAVEKQYDFAKKSTEALQESFTYNEQKFNEGMLNVYDYNDAKNKWAKAESDLLQAKYDYLFKIKILDFFLGKPLTL